MVVMLLAEGFEEIEAVYPIDVLRRCGIEVKTVAVNGNAPNRGNCQLSTVNCQLFVTGANGITIKPDTQLNQIEHTKIQMLILPGGPGRTNIQKSEKAMDLIRNCHKSGVPIAAICGAPEILGELGILKGKRATCYPGLQDKLTGAEFTDAPVVIDENLITSQAAGTSEVFAFAIAEFLCGKEKADEIRSRMLCRS